MGNSISAEEQLGGIRGRGVVESPGNRFERLRVEMDWGAVEEMRGADPEFEARAPKTVFYKDDSQSVISYNASPDLGFEASLNPYRGCEHGCSYCYARPYHEYLGFNAGLDFETKIMVKENAPALLEKELSARKWKPQVLVCSGGTDCYQPVERKLQITRGCLEVLARFRNPVAVVTKNALVTRDADHLGELAKWNAATVSMSITSLDRKLARLLEPRASGPESRLQAIRKLTDAGIPTCVSAAPMIPGLNDHELPAIMKAAAEAGAVTAFYTVVRLPHGVSKMFEDWLDRHFPDRKERVLGRIREMRGGKLNVAEFGERMSGKGSVADEIRKMFEVAFRRCGFDKARQKARLSVEGFRRVGGEQLELGL